MPRCYVRCRWGRRNLVSRSCLDFSVGLDRQRRLRFVARVVLLTLPAYSHFRHTYTLFVYSLFSRLAWARCSRGIRHARCGLFAALLTCLAWVRCSHTPCMGSLFSRYPSHPAWSLRGSFHTPCVGSLFSHAVRGLVVLVVSVTPGVVSSRLFSHTLCGLVVLGEWWLQRWSRG